MAKARNSADPSLEDSILESEETESEGQVVATAMKEAVDEGVIPRVKVGKPLDKDFFNPPCGEEGHLCIRKEDGCYDNTWTQLYIERRDQGDADPVIFPNPGSWPCSVPLNTWVDAPPMVIESLNSAVETISDPGKGSGDIMSLMQKREPAAKPTKYDRKRFIFMTKPSA